MRIAIHSYNINLRGCSIINILVVENYNTMEQTTLLANRFREVILNGKWIANTNLQETIADVTWQQAITQIGSLNTIALLVFHLDYYIGGVLQVLEGGSLDIRDKYSFDMPPIDSQQKWEALKTQIMENTNQFAALVEQLEDKQLFMPFVDEKYGTWYRNLEGMIEHCYYHFGQISLIKKLVLETQ